VQELHQDQYTTSNNKTMNRTVVVMVYRFAHAPTGSFIDVPVSGEGADVGDKSANKALTGAYKYALRQALLIETGDDPDKFPSEPPQNGQRKAQRANNELGLNQKPAGAAMPPAGMKRQFHALGTAKHGDAWDDERPKMVEKITKGRARSSNDLTRDEMQRLIDGMKAAPEAATADKETR
jgi:hypothetical protein